MQHICSNGATLQVDAGRELIWVSFPPRPAGQAYFLADAAAIQLHFDEIAQHLRAIARPQATLVIDYANFDVNPDCNQEYIAGLNQVHGLVSGAVRHSANILQASLLRANNVPAISGMPPMVATEAEAKLLIGALCRVRVAALAG